MTPNDKWYFESGKCYDTRYIDDEYITSFEMYDEYIELFGGEYTSMETLQYLEWSVNDVITEIKQLVAFVYDIPEQFIKVSPNYKNVR